MKAPYEYFASSTRIVYGLRVGTELQEDTLHYRLVIAGLLPSAAETRDFGRLSGAWSALMGAEAAVEFLRSKLDARRLEIALVEVQGGRVLRATIFNPQEEDLRRAERWRDQKNKEA